METGNILYTDGRDVTVTESSLVVRNSEYRLEGITRHGISIIKPNRITGILLTGLGLISFIGGLMKVIIKVNFEIRAFTVPVGPNGLLIIAGIILFLCGIVLMFAQKEKYGVQIVTAEGEKRVLVSYRREYISMVVDALNKAFIKTIKQSGNSQANPSALRMDVSSR